MNALDIIKKIKVVPVVVADDEKCAGNLAGAMVRGGLPVAEVTFRTAAAPAVIASMKASYPEMLVGAGTVLNKTQADTALAAGAEFIVSPGLNTDLAGYCRQRNVVYIPGCITPTEIMAAIECGIKIIKFFPASSFGGLKTIKSLSAPFGDVLFMPTGGINADNVGEYLAFPGIIACGGSWMTERSAIKEGRFDDIECLCREAVSIAAGAGK